MGFMLVVLVVLVVLLLLGYHLYRTTKTLGLINIQLERKYVECFRAMLKANNAAEKLEKRVVKLEKDSQK